MRLIHNIWLDKMCAVILDDNFEILSRLWFENNIIYYYYDDQVIVHEVGP